MKIQFQFPNAMRCNKFGFYKREKQRRRMKKKKKKENSKIPTRNVFTWWRKKRKEKMEHCRCIAELPWQKEFQHFVPLSKAGKRSTTWQHFLLSFFLCRNNLHTFFPACVVAEISPLARKHFLKETKRDWIDQTNIRAAPNDFQTISRRRRMRNEKSQDTSFDGEGKTCDTQTLRPSPSHKVICDGSRFEGQILLLCPCRESKDDSCKFVFFPFLRFFPPHCSWLRSFLFFTFPFILRLVKHGNMWFLLRKFVIRRFSNFLSAPPQEF